MRRHRISDWNVWYGSFGKTDYARQMGNFVLVRSLFDLVVVFPLRLLGLTVNGLVKDYEKRKIAEARHAERIERIVEKIRRLLPSIEPQNSKATIKRSAGQAINLLDELEELGEKRQVIDFDEWRRYLALIVKTADAADYLKKAGKHRFLSDTQKEKTCLLSALHSLIEMKVTNSEFDSLLLEDSTTGVKWTVKGIKKRLLECGYTPS